MSTLQQRLAALTPQQRNALLGKLAAQAAPAAAPSSAAPRGEPDDGALAPAQQRMWLFDSMQGDSAAYNIASVLRLRGRFDAQALERALNALVRRHEILRTRFVDSEGTPRREVLADQPLTLGRATVQPGAVDEAIARLLAAPFRLDEGPLLRVTALTAGAGDTVLVAVLHHIVADGWSLRLIETELSAAYAAALQGTDAALPPAPQYGEYVRRQREWLDSAAPRQLAYWQRQLAGAPACWPLPCERPRDGAGLEAASLLFELPAALCEAARRLAEAENGSTFMVLAAAFKLVLGRFAGTGDISIGTPVANRRERRFDGMIGMCSNTVVLRSRIGEGTFRAYLRQVRQVALDAFSHQDVPFEQVVDTLRPDRSAAYPPLFQVLFALQSTEASVLRLPGLEIEAVQLPRRASEFDLIFELFLGAGPGHGVLTYRRQLLAVATVERLRDTFIALLAQALAAPDTPVDGLLDAQAAPALHGDQIDGAGLLAAHCPLHPGDSAYLGTAVADDMANAARAWCGSAGTPVLADQSQATVLVLGPGELAALGADQLAGRRLVLLHGAEPGAGAAVGAWQCWSDPASGPCVLRAPGGTVHHRGVLRSVNALGQPLPHDAPGEWHWQPDAAAAGIATGLAGRVVRGAARLDGFAAGHAWLDGHRVDLARVEDALVRIPAVTAAAVLARQDRDGVWRGVAYVVLNQKIEPHALAALLAARLPAAWLPAGYVAVNRLPYLRDGTLDCAALARLPVLNAAACARFAAAAGMPAQAVATVWQAPAVPAPLTYERPAAVPRPARPATQPVVPADAQPALAEGAPLQPPTCAWSLAAMLHAAATRHGAHGITYLDDTAAPAQRQSYAALWTAASAVLTGLRAHGVRPGDRVVLQLDDRRDMLTAFWGCVLAGALPVPAAVPARCENGDKHMEKIVNAWPVLAPALVITQEGADTAPLARRLDLVALPQADIAALCAYPTSADWHAGAPDDTALLLLTSGSTGAPKAVRQSHRALISRSQATAQLFGFDSAVVSFNWMPLDHVGGLVMFHLLDVYLGADQIQCPTGAILTQPLRWLDCLSAHRVTNTWAPNFAYALVNEALEATEAGPWDLAPLDFILNGGESIVPRTARTFLRRLAPYGLRSDAMKPAWGMSETCSGVTFNPAFTLAAGSDDDAFVAVGAPVPGVALRIVDGADRVLPEGAEGRLQIRGAPVTAGYFNNDAANAAAFTADGWYVTGDLATLRGGSLTITGREKDVIIVNGLNYHGHELEQIAEEVPDVLEAHVAACAVRGPGHDTDRLALFFSVHERAAGALERVRRALRQALLSRGGIAPTFVVSLAPAEFPRTSIGKIQRLQLAQRFNAGEFDARLDAGAPATLPAWFHAPAWLPAPAPRPARPMPVLLAGTELPADLLRHHATRLVRVLPGERYARLGIDQFTLDPLDTEQWSGLLATLHEETGQGWHIVHATIAWQPEYAALRSVAALARAITTAQPGQVDMLDVVTGAAFALPGDADALPEHAALQGFVRSLALELPAVRCRQIDVGAADPGSLAALATEIGGVAAHDVVALRPAGRYVQALRYCAPEQPPAALSDPGWCVITGGAGGIGAALAAWLLEHTALNVLVLGRSVPQGDAGDPRYARVAQDVCDGAGVAAQLAHYQQRWQVPLTHVFHLAGALVEAPVAALDDAALLHALHAKARGAAVLHDVLADRPGVEIVHFGSANGYFGGAGVAAYAAANAALDALVARRRAAGGRARCLHWSMWDEVGMSRGYALKAQSAARGYLPLAPAQGLDSLWLASSSDAPVVLVGLDAASPNIARHVDAPLAAAWTLRAPAPATACDDFGTPLAVVQEGGIAAAAQPLTPMEQRLAAVWRDVLRVPVDDAAANFFELGGDSIMAIQLVARAAKAGIGLAPRAIFECQTLAELARAAAVDDGAEDDAAPLTGPVPLAPIQRWFFAQDFAARHHMNQSVLLRLQRRIAPDVLRQALQALVRQHDMLRARFVEADGAVVQHLAGDVAVPLDVIAVAPGEAALAQACDALQAGLDLARGPLLRAGYLQGATAADDRLLIVAHHLVVDGVSWRILVDDLEHCIAELEQGRMPRLGRKSTSYRDWVAAQAAQAAASRDAALAYWRDATALPGALPAPAAGANLRGTEQAVELRFDAALTEAVLHALPTAAGMGPDDVLLAAFYDAWRDWAGGRLLLTLEGHGRGGTADGIDLSRTVGWFTAMYPVAIDAPGVPLAALPAALHAQLAVVPGAGRPYLALRHGDDAAARAVLAAGHAPAVSFNYLGRFDVEDDRLLRFASEAPGAQIAPGQQRIHELDVVGAVVDGALRMSFIHGAERYPRTAVAALAERFAAALRALAEAPAARRWTAEHPDLAAQLAARGIAAADVDSVAPATPMQAGMIYESQVSGVAGTFVSHLVNELGGALDTAALRAAWQGVVARHAVYRTAFVPGRDGGWLQVVLRRATLPWVELDWSALPADEQEARFARLLDDDARAGFAPDRAPLLRIHLIRMAPARYRMLVAEHHCVSDGWSRGIVLADVAALYRGAGVLAPAVPFGRYADWLRGFDAPRAQAYWDGLLAGAAPLPPFACQAPARADKGGRGRAAPPCAALERRAERPVGGGRAHAPGDAGRAGAGCLVLDDGRPHGPARRHVPDGACGPSPRAGWRRAHRRSAARHRARAGRPGWRRQRGRRRPGAAAAAGRARRTRLPAAGAQLRGAGPRRPARRLRHIVRVRELPADGAAGGRRRT